MVNTSSLTRDGFWTPRWWTSRPRALSYARGATTAYRRWNDTAPLSYVQGMETPGRFQDTRRIQVFALRHGSCYVHKASSCCCGVYCIRHCIRHYVRCDFVGVFSPSHCCSCADSPCTPPDSNTHAARSAPAYATYALAPPGTAGRRQSRLSPPPRRLPPHCRCGGGT